MALGVAIPRATEPFINLDSLTPLPLGSVNVILWGAAVTPLNNGQYIARRLQEIRPILEKLVPRTGGSKFVTLYGHGPSSSANDTSVMMNDTVSFMRADIPADLGADADGINSVLTAVKRSRGTRNLLVHVGHSGPAGAPLWGQLGTLTAEDLRRVAQDGEKDLTVVSGGCNSGIFARSVTCGFFAAHPEVIATGCQLSREVIEHSDDYLKLFFDGVQIKDNADSNADGKVSFAEAHWFASMRIEDHQLSYTTIDAMADAYFRAEPERLPQHQTVADIRALGDHATPEERRALKQLTMHLDPATTVSLDDAVVRNHDAHQRLEHARELSSAQRNSIIALPYKLMLPMLARRLLYKSKAPERGELKSVSACEARPLVDFLDSGSRYRSARRKEHSETVP